MRNTITIGELTDAFAAYSGHNLTKGGRPVFCLLLESITEPDYEQMTHLDLQLMYPDANDFWQREFCSYPAIHQETVKKAAAKLPQTLKQYEAGNVNDMINISLDIAHVVCLREQKKALSWLKHFSAKYRLSKELSHAEHKEISRDELFQYVLFRSRELGISEEGLNVCIQQFVLPYV